MTRSLVSLRLDREKLAALDDEPSKYHRTIAGDLVLPDDDFIKEYKIGRFRVRIVDLDSAMNDEYSLFDVFDAHAVTWAFFDELYTQDFEISDKVLKALGMPNVSLSPNLLILDRLEILPKWRGQGHGLAAMMGMMHWFRTGIDLIALKAFPLQFAAGSKNDSAFDKYRLDAFKDSLSVSKSKLLKHYEQLGFKRIGRMGYMVRLAGVPVVDALAD